MGTEVVAYIFGLKHRGYFFLLSACRGISRIRASISCFLNATIVSMSNSSSPDQVDMPAMTREFSLNPN